MSIIVVAATFDAATRKKDRSVSMRFTTNAEIDSNDYLKMDQKVLGEGWLAWADNPAEIAIPEEAATSREGKSKGQRMRSVFFLIWKKKGLDEAFDPWYDRQFEKAMDTWKGELD